MVFMAFLVHHSWIGEKLLRPYLEAAWNQGRPVDELHPIFDVPPLKRMTAILHMYNLSWLTVYNDWNRPWAKRLEVASKIEEEIMLPAFIQYIHTSIATGSKGIPHHHRRQLLRDMAVPTNPKSPAAIALAGLLPLFEFVPHDLPTAGIRFQAPYLRLQPRGVDRPRESCAWCHAPDSEYGYHLLRCRMAPQRIMVLRLRALRLIHLDCQPLTPAAGDVASDANLGRLFSLSWIGLAAWQPNRKDKGRQPSLEALQAALLYMREAINEYAVAVAGTGPQASDPVWKIPVFLRATRPSAEELAEVAQQQLAQPFTPAVGPFLPPLDSLQRLNFNYPDGDEGIGYTSDDEEEEGNALADDADAAGHGDGGQPFPRVEAPRCSLQALGASEVVED
jgi:hypothetical protein